MSRAVFKDTDGRWTYVMGDTEYDLGYYRPNRYIWAAPIGSNANPQQVCNGGGFRGNTLSWPHGAMIPGTWRKAEGRSGHKFSVCDYSDLPDCAILEWLSTALGARIYGSRKSFERYYAPEMETNE